VIVDEATCQGHGMCYLAAPDVFAPDAADGHSVVLVDIVPADLVASARLGAQGCPERAITVVDDHR
jgi:ferredoxin